MLEKVEGSAYGGPGSGTLGFYHNQLDLQPNTIIIIIISYIVFSYAAVLTVDLHDKVLQAC